MRHGLLRQQTPNQIQIYGGHQPTLKVKSTHVGSHLAPRKKMSPAQNGAAITNNHFSIFDSQSIGN
jgi:hypothetical protein